MPLDALATPPPGPSSATPRANRPALVHDYLLVLRGAERTFAALAGCWPDAPLFTLLYDEQGTHGAFAGRDVTTSYLQRLGVGQSGFRRLLPLFPRAAERLPVGEHDVVVSSSSAWAHGVRPRPGATHICYCHSPFRYAWHERETALTELPAPLRPALRVQLARIRRWDRRAGGRVTHLIANSEITRRRIADFWDRDAQVVHPPVAVERFTPSSGEDFALVVCEVVRHKRVDVALAAARRAGMPIKVVGQGPDLERLQALHGDHAEFLGRVDDDRLTRLYARARVFVMPNVEEFGIAAVEAQAAGRPVVAAAAGGALETVRPGLTGVHVAPGSVDELAEALRETDFDRFDPQAVAAHARTFSTEAFQTRMSAEVERLTAASPGG